MTQAGQPFQTDEQIAKGFDPQISRHIWMFIRPYSRLFFTSLVLMIVGSGAAVAGPYLIKVALDEGLAVGSLPALRNTVLLYLLVALLQWTVIFIRVNLMAFVGQSIIYDLRSQIFKHLQELSVSFFSHYSVGRIISRVMNDVTVLRDFIVWTILAIARDLFTMVGILVVMLSMNLRLSLLTFTVLPLMIISTIFFRRRARDNYRKARSAISWVNSVLAENINGVRVVQSFSRQEKNYTHFKDEVNHYNLSIHMTAARLSSLFFPTIGFLGNLAMALVIWVGGTAILGDQITPGILVAFVLYINRFFEPIRDLSQRFDALQSTMASGERILELLNAEVEVQDSPEAVDLPVLNGRVDYESVSFHYPDDDQQSVLEEFDLHIAPGETVALVGRTGAGKSTVVKLLSRFHDPTSGRVLIDGYDLRNVTQASLRRQMGIVLQDPFLFAGTVNDNIRFGRLDASDEDVQAAAKAVGAHEFILRMREGYDTPVEEGGALLSVGQRQLISFARALLANPRILILDEATSSVDTQTERIIQQALARLLKGRTAFVIAHRLSTVVNADRIVVIEDGRIVEQGSHTELLMQKGAYYRLYSMRFEEMEA